jgi:ribose/xylose/arabinose/galactoside ABC-type transport system permease subunit
MTGKTSAAGWRPADLLGFGAIFVLIFAGFAVLAPSFLTIGNVMAMLHAMGPSTIAACGMAMVILLGKIDISIGSIAFLSASLGGTLMEGYGLSPVAAMPLIVAIGAFLGAVNGFLVAIAGINALIATLGTMIGFRGLGLMLTEARVIPLPEAARGWGNATVGPVFVDVFVTAAVLVAIHILHRRNVYGRRVTAIGNSEETARRIGLPIVATVFATFVLAGALAGLSAAVSYVQVGSISGFLGKGLEFTRSPSASSAASASRGAEAPSCPASSLARRRSKCSPTA